MAEIDSFQTAQTQEQQSEYLKSINQSMTRLVDVSERSQNSASQYFQSNSVQSTVASLRDITQGAYDRFSEDVVSSRDSLRSATGRALDFTNTATGTARELGSHVPTIQPLAPVSTTGFFGNTPAYSTNYRSTFWNDLWAGPFGDRAPQTMFQSDFSQMGYENLTARMHALSPLRATANLMGVSTSLDEDVITANMATSQRYTRAGTSRALSGVGSTRGEIIGIVEHERGKLLDQLGYNYDDFQASKQIFAAGGQFIGTKSELERSNIAFAGMGEAEKIAKVLAVPIQEAARAMMDVRSQLGITSLSGQASFIQSTQSAAMASGLSFQEALGGALAGASLSRQSGFSVRTGGTLGRDILTSVNAAYLDRAIGENLIQSAGGVQNLSSNLASSAIQFASGPGSMYYMASMKDGQFDQSAFNKASGGFGQLGSMAASNASTIQGYANFIANSDNIQAQGGSFNVMSMQRSQMHNVFKSATGRDFDSSSTEDTNMMKMLAASSGMFTDPTTAKAFVEMNFTESGQDSMYAAQRDAYKAEKQLKYKTNLDQRFKGNSTDALARSIGNIWNKPAQGLRGWFNDTFEDMGGVHAQEERYMWASGQMPIGSLSKEDVSEFSKAGGFSANIASYTNSPAEPWRDTPNIFSRSLTGMYEGASVGLKVGGAVTSGALAAGLGMMAVGGLLSATGVGAVIGAPLIAAGGATALWGGLGGLGVTVAGIGAGMVAGGAYGAAGTYMQPGNAPLTADQIKSNDRSVAAWNRGGGFSTAEKNTMGDPDFQKKVVQKLMEKGIGSINKISSENQMQVLGTVRDVAKELGVSEEMVANIAQTKAGITGDPLYGADMQWTQVGAAGMEASGKALSKDLKESFGDKFGDLINDSEFTGGLGRLLSSGGDQAERKMAASKFLGSFEGRLSEDARASIDQYVATGAINNREGLAAGLTQRSMNLRSIKVKDSIGSMFGARAKDEANADVADEYNQIANASSPSQQVGLLLKNLSDERFRGAIERDPSLKRLLPLDSPLDRKSLEDTNVFKERFGFNRSQDDLKELQALFDKSGEGSVRARLAGEIVSSSAKSDPMSSKVNESQILSDAAAAIKDAAVILKTMKNGQ